MGAHALGTATDVVFGLESVADCREDVMRLAEAHGAEFTYHKELKGPVDPDWDAALNLEALGAFKICTLRDAGILVGYLMFISTKMSHYRTVPMCYEDTFYVAPEYRGTMLGYRFIKFCIEAMKETGARVLRVSNKMKADYGPMWKRLGFEPEEIVYTMTLGA